MIKRMVIRRDGKLYIMTRKGSYYCKNYLDNSLGNNLLKQFEPLRKQVFFEQDEALKNV